MDRIVLTGGGTAGHVTPNIALIPHLIEKGYEIHYIGTKNGIEHNLISQYNNVTYHSVQSGKLRRYRDIKNLTDPFKVIYGVGQSASIIRKLKPSIVFSKGGFVSVPVVIGAWMNHIPVIVHESDITPGLANKIATKFAKKVCTTFPETVDHFKDGKAEYTGTPIRRELLEGSAKKGLEICQFNGQKPVLMIMGGSLGAVAVNNCIRDIIKKLINRFNVIHICGKGNIDEKYNDLQGYAQFEYVSDDLPHLMAAADIIVSRAGANSIYEFLALKKPCLLIPLPLSASRGDQILNAKSFEKQGFSKVLMQEDMNIDTLYISILDLYNNKNKYIQAMSKQDHANSLDKILSIIDQYAKE